VDYSNPDAEEAQENATLALLAELGWEIVNAHHGTCCFPASSPGRLMYQNWRSTQEGWINDPGI